MISLEKKKNIQKSNRCFRYNFESEVAELCLTLCDPVDCSLPGFSIHGIFQARVLEWGAISFSRVSSRPRDWNQVSHIVSKTLYRLSQQINWCERFTKTEAERLKNWCFQTVLEKTLESPLDSKEIKPVNSILKDIYPKYSLKKQAEAEAPILWPHDAKSWLTGKYDAGKDWRQKEKKAAEDEMVSRQHHWLNGYESEETLGDSEGQRSLMCYSLWGHKELDVT